MRFAAPRQRATPEPGSVAYAPSACYKRKCPTCSSCDLYFTEVRAIEHGLKNYPDDSNEKREDERKLHTHFSRPNALPISYEKFKDLQQLKKFCGEEARKILFSASKDGSRRKI
uniref:Uncharacterized protein n=1 Tax=Timema douglasi TaxID=61478 RepID=A0A7R8VQD1_TIMDO|nr:unnamed protein product [Timema douglasi]